MTGSPWRGPLGLSCRRCLLVAAMPTLLAAAAATALHWRLRPDLGDETAPAAASPWLLLPMLVAAATCALAATVFWPTFARGRPGRDWVLRTQRGRLGGLGGAIAGALLAQLLLTLPLTTLLARALGAPGAARAIVTLVAQGDPVLDERQPRLVFAVPTGEALCELRLRPMVGLPVGPWHGTTVAAFADGEPLPPLPAAFADDRQLVRVPFPARPVREVTLVRTGGTVPLAFVPGSASVLGDAQHSTLANGAVFALLALLPGLVALALGGLCGLAAGLPTVVAVVLCAMLLQTAGGVGVFDSSLVALFRGQWLLPGAVFPRCAPSLAVGGVAMILTMLLRPRVGR